MKQRIYNEVNYERLLETTRDFLAIRTLKAKLDYLTVMHTSADTFQELLSQADYYIPSLRVDKSNYETNANWKDRQELIHFYNLSAKMFIESGKVRDYANCEA